MSVFSALTLAFGVGASALALAFCVAPALGGTLLIYLALNILYSFHLKHLAILDVLLISAGFILRLIAGGLGSGVTISAWLLQCAFFLSLFLAFGKRRAELNRPEAPASRAVLQRYTQLMLDRFTNIAATLALAAYGVFTVVSRPDHSLLITCPPVVYGIFRYLFLLESCQVGETPEMVVLRDGPIQLALGTWVLTYTAVIYGGLRISAL